MSVDTARWRACATMVAQTLVFAASRLVSTLAVTKHKHLIMFSLAAMPSKLSGIAVDNPAQLAKLPYTDSSQPLKVFVAGGYATG